MQGEHLTSETIQENFPDTKDIDFQSPRSVKCPAQWMKAKPHQTRQGEVSKH